MVTDGGGNGIRLRCPDLAMAKARAEAREAYEGTVDALEAWLRAKAIDWHLSGACDAYRAAYLGGARDEVREMGTEALDDLEAALWRLEEAARKWRSEARKARGWWRVLYWTVGKDDYGNFVLTPHSGHGAETDGDGDGNGRD